MTRRSWSDSVRAGCSGIRARRVGLCARKRVSCPISPFHETGGETPPFLGLAAPGASLLVNRRARRLRELAEAFDDAFGDRAGFAGADGAGIQLDGGDDFGRSAGEEAFVGGVDIVAGELSLVDGETELRVDIEH